MDGKYTWTLILDYVIWLTYNPIVYNFSNDIYNGEGELYIDNKLYYKGSFKNGIKNNIGTLYNNNYIIYSGDFYNDIYI